MALSAAGSRGTDFSVCHSRNDRQWCRSCNFEGQVGQNGGRDALRAPQQMADIPAAGPPAVDALPVMPSDLQDLERVGPSRVGVCRLWNSRQENSF